MLRYTDGTAPQRRARPLATTHVDARASVTTQPTANAGSHRSPRAAVGGRPRTAVTRTTATSLALPSSAVRR